MTTHTNLALVEGEVYILSEEQKFKEKYVIINGKRIQKENDTPFNRERFFIDENILVPGSIKLIVASTAKMEGTSRLDRKHFVKPKVDVDELVKKYIKGKEKYFEYHMNDSGVDYVEQSFIDGYNAKEAEFTREDMEEAMSLMFIHGQQNVVSKEFAMKETLNMLSPLQLPASVTLNENNEVISVEWA